MKKSKDPLSTTVFDEFLPTALSKSQRRRLQIIEAMIEVLASRGIEGATYDRVARQSKSSRGLVQHYFPDLDELILVTIKYIRARFQKYAIQAIQSKQTPTAQLEAYSDCTFDYMSQNPKDARIWFLYYFYSAFRPHYFKLNTDLVEQGHARIGALLRSGVQSGEFADGNIEARAKQIQTLITGGLVELYTEAPMAPMDLKTLIRLSCLTVAKQSGI